MSGFEPADQLRRYRSALLALEATGWLHMAGKARSEFLRQHGGEKIQFDYKKWHALENPPFDWEQVVGWVRGCLPKNVGFPQSFADFIEKHTERSSGILGLLQSAHGIVSGVEKNVPAQTSEYLAQNIPHMWLLSAFGHPKRNLLASPPEVLTEQGWRRLVDEIKRILDDLKALHQSTAQEVSSYYEWRERAIGSESYLRKAFLSTVAETRVPNNDVTLWDQSYVAAALFKSAAAGALLEGSAFPSNDSSIKQKIRWRLLTVAVNSDHYEQRAVRIGDWTGTLDVLEAFFKETARLIEVDLAIGSLIYKDAYAAIFSFPGERFDAPSTPAQWLQGWDQYLVEHIEQLARSYSLETPPQVQLSHPTRSLVPIIAERKRTVAVIAIPVFKPWDIELQQAEGHQCPVCQVRPNGDPSDKGLPCSVCRSRRERRLSKWLLGETRRETIWFEEVSDSNDRLAVISLSLGVEPWLDGNQVDSLRTQSIAEWRRFNPLLGGQPNPVNPEQPYESLVEYASRQIQQGWNNQDTVFTSLQDGYRFDKSWEDFFAKIVEDRTSQVDWNILDDNQRARWVIHQLFRKLPSPGRVYRFWREVEEFFEALQEEFRLIAARSANRWRTRRLLLLSQQSRSGFRDRTLYTTRWRNGELSLLYLAELKGFLTVSNLARFLAPHETSSVLKGQQLKLMEENEKKAQILDACVAEVKEVSNTYAYLGVCHPIIVLGRSPMRFRVVAPLEAASTCVDVALEKARVQFARVWDRLPMQVGVVGFHRQISFQAVVEAVRRIEAELSKVDEEWYSVARREKCNDCVALQLRRPGGRHTTRVVPLKLPDGRLDVFYPYAEICEKRARFPYDFQHPTGTVYRFMGDLRAGDGIRVHPSRVITLFMGSGADCFLPLERSYAEDWEEMRQIWLLITNIAPSQTAVQQLRSSIMQLESRWQSGDATPEVYYSTLRAFIATHLECQGVPLETLTEAAVNGILQWALEWHMTALKETI